MTAMSGFKELYGIGEIFKVAGGTPEFQLKRLDFDARSLEFMRTDDGAAFIYSMTEFEEYLDNGNIIKVRNALQSGGGSKCQHKRRGFIGLTTGRWACADCGEWLD